MPEDHAVINCPYQEDFGYARARLENIAADIAEIKKLLKDQNGRIRKTELIVARIMAIGGVLVILIPILVRILWR